MLSEKIKIEVKSVFTVIFLPQLVDVFSPAITYPKCSAEDGWLQQLRNIQWYVDSVNMTER